MRHSALTSPIPKLQMTPAFSASWLLPSFQLFRSEAFQMIWSPPDSCCPLALRGNMIHKSKQYGDVHFLPKCPILKWNCAFGRIPLRNILLLSLDFMQGNWWLCFRFNNIYIKKENMELTIFGIDYVGYMDASVLPQWYLNVALLVLKRSAEKYAWEKNEGYLVKDWGWTKQCKITKDFGVKTRMLFQKGKKNKYKYRNIRTYMSFLTTFSMKWKKIKKYSCSILFLHSASQPLDPAPEVCVTSFCKMLCEITWVKSLWMTMLP